MGLNRSLQEAVKAEFAIGFRVTKRPIREREMRLGIPSWEKESRPDSTWGGTGRLGATRQVARASKHEIR